MLHCEACEKDINMISKSSNIKSTAHIRKNFRINNDLTDKK